MDKPISVEITDASEFHCFRMRLNTRTGQAIEILLHAAVLVDLIHECSVALGQWQRETTARLICQKTGMTEEEARGAGLIA